MKLVLVQPPIQDFYDTKARLQPLGLAYLKGAVKKYLPEVEVVIKDFHHGRGRKTVALPGELAYLKEFYPYPDQSPFSLFHHFYHFGASFETLAREVAEEKPDLVGISSLFSPYYREVLRSAEAIKRKTGSPIVLGGSHVSAKPELMLESPAVDWVIRGEGERPLVELIKAWRSGLGLEQVPGLGFKQGGDLVFNPPGDPFPMEELPLPDFSDLDPGVYSYENRPMSFVLTSRGCPHHCSFCSVHSTFPAYRKRAALDVFEEMKGRYQEGYRVFDFEDDNLTYDREEMIHLCRKIKQGFAPGAIELLAMNGISYQSLDFELLQLMKEAGFTHLNLSLVTANPAVRKETLRTQKMEKYHRVIAEAFALGFKLVSYQILGLPGESLPSMIRTMRLNCRLPVLLGASPFYLTPGTSIARKFPGQTEKDIFQSRLTALGLETDRFKPPGPILLGRGTTNHENGQVGLRPYFLTKRNDIYTLLMTTRIINFFKGLRFEENPISLEDALKEARKLGKRAALGVELFERLMAEGRLSASTPEGPKPLTGFKAGLFFQFWSELHQIITREGKRISLTSS